MNAFDDPKVAQAITATGRKKLILVGISLEVCAAFPAITAVVTAVGKGLDAYVAVHASGTFSETKRQVAISCRLCARALRPKADRSRVEYRGAVGDRGSRKTYPSPIFTLSQTCIEQ